MEKYDEEGIRLPTPHPGVLVAAEWYRVILDEAQSIKNKLTRCSIAASALKSERRWCLSGTPIQNNIDDLYSLYRFLKIEPYCNYRFFRANLFSGKRILKRGLTKLRTLIRA